MIAGRGEWFYIDFTGDVYRIRPTGYYEGCPVEIQQVTR
jgi:hypothetical protein